MGADRPETNPVGRPTKYRPAFCDKIIEAGKIGCSRARFAVLCGISIDTLYQWAKEIPELSEALTLASAYSQDWWEEQGRKGAWDDKESGHYLNSSYTKQMAARFPKDWRENKQLELSGEIKTETTVKFAERPIEVDDDQD